MPDPTKVVSSGEVLGCCAAFVPHKPSAKELSRVDAAKRTTRFLACLPLSWSKYHLYIRYFAVSKALYGWVSRRIGICGL